MIHVTGVGGWVVVLLLLVQFVLIAWKTIAIFRIQRDLTALSRFVHTWGERMLTKTTVADR